MLFRSGDDDIIAVLASFDHCEKTIRTTGVNSVMQSPHPQLSEQVDLHIHELFGRAVFICGLIMVTEK